MKVTKPVYHDYCSATREVTNQRMSPTREKVHVAMESQHSQKETNKFKNASFQVKGLSRAKRPTNPQADTHRLCLRIKMKSLFKASRLMAPPADRHSCEAPPNSTPTRGMRFSKARGHLPDGR